MKKAMIFIFLMLMVIPISGYSLGVASPYTEDNIYKIVEGQSAAEYIIWIQNMEDTDKTVTVEVTSDNNIAAIRDYKESYVIKSKTVDNPIYIDLKIPETAKIGDKYNISIKVLALSSDSGQVVVSGAITQRFTAQIVEEGNGSNLNIPEETKPDYIMLLGIVAIFAILAVMMFSKKSSMSKRGKK